MQHRLIYLLAVQTVAVCFISLVGVLISVATWERRVQIQQALDQKLQVELRGMNNRRPKSVTVDLIEFNKSKRYNPPIEQVIFWRWDNQYQRYEVRTWAKRASVNEITPHSLKFRGWQVKSESVIYTETEHDPEQDDLRLCPHDERLMMPWGWHYE